MGIFKPDGFIYSVIVKFTNMVLLSLCWLIFSIPIFTIGASTAALYAVCFKMLKDEESHVVKMFISYFRSNFSQATKAWLILLPFGGIILYMSYLYFFGMARLEGASDYLAMIILIAAAVFLITLTYVFACAARYENTARQTIKNAVFIGLRYIGRTIILAAITLTVLFVCAWNMTTVFLGIILAPAFICYVHGSFIIRIFQNLEETKGQTESEPI